MPLFLVYYFTDWYWDFLPTVFCLGVAWWCVKWSGGLIVLGAALTWLWLGLKSLEDLSHCPQWGPTVRTSVNCPIGRFAWTNHILLPNNPARAVVTLHLCADLDPWFRPNLWNVTGPGFKTGRSSPCSAGERTPREPGNWRSRTMAEIRLRTRVFFIMIFLFFYLYHNVLLDPTSFISRSGYTVPYASCLQYCGSESGSGSTESTCFWAYRIRIH